jgi:hypothetical protein
LRLSDGSLPDFDQIKKVVTEMTKDESVSKIDKILESNQGIMNDLKRAMTKDGKLDLSKVNTAELEKFADASGQVDIAKVEKTMREKIGFQVDKAVNRADSTATQTPSTAVNIPGTQGYDPTIAANIPGTAGTPSTAVNIPGTAGTPSTAVNIPGTTGYNRPGTVDPTTGYPSKKPNTPTKEQIKERVKQEKEQEKIVKEIVKDPTVKIRTPYEIIKDKLNENPQLGDALTTAVNSRGKLDFEKIDPSIIEKFTDKNTGLLDYSILEQTAKNLAKKQRLQLISGKQVIDKATGQIDKISETLATDPQAKNELLDAVNDDGQIDFSKIEPENLDKFRDPTTQKLDLQKLENIAKDLVELEKSKPAGERDVKKPVFDKTNPQSSYNKIRETLATDSYAREQLR